VPGELRLGFVSIRLCHSNKQGLKFRYVLYFAFADDVHIELVPLSLEVIFQMLRQSYSQTACETHVINFSIFPEDVDSTSAAPEEFPKGASVSFDHRHGETIDMRVDKRFPLLFLFILSFQCLFLTKSLVPEAIVLKAVSRHLAEHLRCSG